MKYQIEINYNSGDSYKVERDIVQYLEIEFEKLSVAEKNLERIKEHYEMYLELNSYFVQDVESIINKYKYKDWFVKKLITVAFKKETPEAYNAISEKNIEYCKNNGYEVAEKIQTSAAKSSIKLVTDNGEIFQISPFWCGTFESLNSIQIKIKFLKYEF